MLNKLQRYQFSVLYKKDKELYILDTFSCALVADYPTAASIRQE